MKGDFSASKISRFYSVFSIFLIIILLGGCLPPVLAKPATVYPTDTSKSYDYAPVATNDTYTVDRGHPRCSCPRCA